MSAGVVKSLPNFSAPTDRLPGRWSAQDDRRSSSLRSMSRFPGRSVPPGSAGSETSRSRSTGGPATSAENPSEGFEIPLRVRGGRHGEERLFVTANANRGDVPVGHELAGDRRCRKRIEREHHHSSQWGGNQAAAGRAGTPARTGAADAAAGANAIDRNPRTEARPNTRIHTPLTMMTSVRYADRVPYGHAKASANLHQTSARSRRDPSRSVFVGGVFSRGDAAESRDGNLSRSVLSSLAQRRLEQPTRRRHAVELVVRSDAHRGDGEWVVRTVDAPWTRLAGMSLRGPHHLNLQVPVRP